MVEQLFQFESQTFPYNLPCIDTSTGLVGIFHEMSVFIAFVSPYQSRTNCLRELSCKRMFYWVYDIYIYQFLKLELNSNWIQTEFSFFVSEIFTLLRTILGILEGKWNMWARVSLYRDFQYYLQREHNNIHCH